jgi:hypothetical protein
MGQIIYLAIMSFLWAVVGVLTDGHKGALVAAIVGLFLMIFLAIGFIANREEGDPANPVARAFCGIVFWTSIPLALLMWGNKAVGGGGAVLIIFSVAIGTLVIRLIALGLYKAEQRWGTG